MPLTYQKDQDETLRDTAGNVVGKVDRDGTVRDGWRDKGYIDKDGRYHDEYGRDQGWTTESTSGGDWSGVLLGGLIYSLIRLFIWMIHTPKGRKVALILGSALVTFYAVCGILYLAMGAEGGRSPSTTTHAATATAQAQVEATATAIATDISTALTRARKKMEAGDWYLAAADLQTALATYPDNDQIRNLLAEIKPHVPGAVVLPDGYYYDFSDNPIKKIPGLPADSRIEHVGPSGKRIEARLSDDHYYILDLMAAQKIPEEVNTIGCYSPDLSQVAHTLARTGARIASIGVGTVEKPQIETRKRDVEEASLIQFGGCLRQQSYDDVLWLDEQTLYFSRFYKDKGESDEARYFTLWDLASDTLRDVKLPGFTKWMVVRLTPDRNKVYIIGGNKVVSSDLEGRQIKTVAALPDELAGSTQWGDVYLLPDGQTLLLIGAGKGNLISLRTGEISTLPIDAFCGEKIAGYPLVGWANTVLDAASVAVSFDRPVAVLHVMPSDGPIGTRFQLAWADAPTDSALEWRILSPRKTVELEGSGQLDKSGRHQDFAFATDLSLRCWHLLCRGDSRWPERLVGCHRFVRRAIAVSPSRSDLDLLAKRGVVLVAVRATVPTLALRSSLLWNGPVIRGCWGLCLWA